MNTRDLAPPPVRCSHNSDSRTMGFAGGSPTITPEQVVNHIGSVAPEHFAHAQALLSTLPESVHLGVREQHSAMAIAFALALEIENPQVY